MIRQLPPKLVREIAAGEVISAPVDVVKELLENALDAGATRLVLRLVEGGKDRLQLSDNASGIPAEQLPLALDAHCTSKLRDIEAINTLGFRGEGLYAIRHAATIEITSRPKAQLGARTIWAQGDELRSHDHPGPAGTNVVVSSLFEQLPARRQSLDSAANERKRILALLTRYILHYPHLQVTFDGGSDSESWSYAAGGTVDAVKFFWGSVTANRLLRLEASEGPYQIKGMISRPELSRAKRDRLLLAVNGRPVAWPDALLLGVMATYKTLLPANQYPVGVINFTVPPQEVLVNTSPDKGQVRFLQLETVRTFIEEAIKTLMRAHPLAKALPELHEAQVLQGAPRHAFPVLGYLGVFRELYLLAEGDGMLWVVDQHAAHERVLFEVLKARYHQEALVELPEPELLTFHHEEASTLEARLAQLEPLGVTLEPFGGGVFRLRRVPALLLGAPNLIGDIVRSLALSTDPSGADPKEALEQAWTATLARLACLPAIKAGHDLSNEGAQALLDALQRCETPWSCPHGRPTALVLSELELARRFGRRSTRSTLAEPLQAPKPA